jgi:hypothetical protein
MTLLERKMLRTMAATAAAALLLLSAGQASAATCAGRSVDGPAPRRAMCFGTMFPALPAFRYSDRAAADLAATMDDPTPDPAGTDRGTRDDSATLPAEYTYLGQFIDHNLDFDETVQPGTNVNPGSLSNYESFRFDLNNVFGGGPSVDPQLYASDHRHLLVSGTLGRPQADGFPSVTGNGGVFDLARNASGGQAILVEPRDDENQILSQISAAFVAFYNSFVSHGLGYTQARQLTEDYYQEIVLTDVLPAYVGRSTINRYLTFGSGGAAHVNTPNLPNANFTPIEFSVGAYRFGHALVRDNYHINDIFPTSADIDDNVSIFNLGTFQYGDLSGAPRCRVRTGAVRRPVRRPRSATSPTRPAIRSSGSTSSRRSTPTRTTPGSTSPGRRSRRSASRCSTSRRRRSRAVPTQPRRYATAPVI